MYIIINMARKKSIKIKVLMLRKGISGAEIGRKLGLTRYAVNGVINFRWKSPTVRKAISDALGISYKELWGVIEGSERGRGRPRRAA